LNEGCFALSEHIRRSAKLSTSEAFERLQVI
jgi:hypothetical protein